jgi:PKD repeat protein
MKEGVSAPSASFSVVAPNPAASSPVQFLEAASGDAISWSWDFGDGAGSTLRTPSHIYGAPGFYAVRLTVTTPRGTATTSQLVEVSAADTLTLNAAHSFDVTLTAVDQRTGRTGTGQAIPQNDHFGYFSIPDLTGDPTNPEVFVKVLDGTAINGNYWTFYGGLTDLEYTISVKENATGRVKTYHKEAGSACGGFDTSGFDATPTPTVGESTPTPTPPSSPSATPSTSATPTPTPTPAAAIVVNLVATDFQWNFDGGGSTFNMRVGQTYQLHISDGDPIGRAAHGFGGVPGLGIPARALQAGGAPVIVTFTPSASQTGVFVFSCDQPSCGSGHSNMIGAIQVMP